MRFKSVFSLKESTPIRIRRKKLQKYLRIHRLNRAFDLFLQLLVMLPSAIHIRQKLTKQSTANERYFFLHGSKKTTAYKTKNKRQNEPLCLY